MSDFSYLAQFNAKLWCIAKDENGNSVHYPVVINDQRQLQIERPDVEPETFIVGKLQHPKRDGGIAYELRGSAGSQVTGAGGSDLQLAKEELPVPGPAFIIAEYFGYAPPPDGSGQMIHRATLKTFDTRFVSINEKYSETVVKDREFGSAVGEILWRAFFGQAGTKVKVTVYKERQSTKLRMIDESQGMPNVFAFQVLDESLDQDTLFQS